MSQDCIFCQIAQGKIEAQVVAQNQDAIAIVDLNPQAPTHILVIPRIHLSRIAAAKVDKKALLGSLLLFAAEVAKTQGVDDYRMVINNGEKAGQTVFHLHLHLLAGREFSWPPG